MGISNRSIKRVNTALKDKEEKVQKEPLESVSNESIFENVKNEDSFTILRKNDKKKELPEFLL